MRIVSTKEQLLDALQGHSRVGLVMTMGALHGGHLSLVKHLRSGHDCVVATIFVNPQQFGEGEDLDTYPRTLEADVQALKNAQVDILYVPTEDQVYPVEPRVRVQPGPAGKVLEGYLRPGHFAGVLQVVGKMFNLVRPATAVFGQKDAQQFVNISQMVADLDQQVELIEAPIVRDARGLALSSRNSYLSERQLSEATALHASLVAGETEALRGRTPEGIVRASAEVLKEAPGVEPEYVALADATSFDVFAMWTPDGQRLGVERLATPTSQHSDAYLVLAARVGPARLIDNVKVKIRDE